MHSLCTTQINTYIVLTLILPLPTKFLCSMQPVRRWCLIGEGGRGRRSWQMQAAGPIIAEQPQICDGITSHRIGRELSSFPIASSPRDLTRPSSQLPFSPTTITHTLTPSRLHRPPHATTLLPSIPLRLPASALQVTCAKNSSQTIPQPSP